MKKHEVPTDYEQAAHWCLQEVLRCRLPRGVYDVAHARICLALGTNFTRGLDTVAETIKRVEAAHVAQE